jgi:twitching motility protein PilU
MQTFDQALFNLYREGIISYEVALGHADSANDLRLMIKLNSDTNPDLEGDDLPSFTLQDEEDTLNIKGNADVKGM